MNKNVIEQIYDLSDNFSEKAETKLKELLKPYKKGAVGIAQLNPIVGDIEYNATNVVKYITHAQNIGIELVIFPELTLIGNPIGNITKRYPAIAQENFKWLEQISKLTTKTTAIVGFLEQDKESFYHSFAILSNGKIQKIIRKNKDYFEISVNEAKYLIASNIQKAEYSKYRSLAKENSCPLICVNQVGAIDNIVFDGASTVFNKNGEIFARAKEFEEQFLIVNIEKSLKKIYPSISAIQEECKHQNFSLDYEYDLERTYKTIVLGIKDYFWKTGFKRAVLGLSGGLDSTVCAVLLADALGAENVLGISMPSKITSNESKTDAEKLAHNLGINFTVMPIKEIVETTSCNFSNLFENIEKKWGNRYKQSFTNDNIQARSRAVILWGVSNEFGKCLPIATSDKSEAYMGYATINGDMSGGFAPIADVTKTKLFALARWLNKNREVKNAIPESVILKKPGAELAIDPKTGKPLIAEDALMPYEFLDEVIWRIENKNESYEQMLNSEFLYEKKNQISKEQKIEWLDKFYRRMATSLYKGSILPPFVVVDSNSLNKYNYKQPITSSRITYKSLSEEEILNKIQVNNNL